jgi:exopolysaccharide biosynthesis WecB/TagA/CpsF family protein
MIDHGKHNILGIQISAVDYDAAVEKIITAAHARQPLAISALAVHGLMTGALDAIHRFRLNRFDLLVPDGQPVRWALRTLHRVNLPDRVYGPTLMMRVCERAANEQLPIYLFGSTTETLRQLSTNLVNRFPQLQIAGVRASRFRQLSLLERDETIQDIRRSGANIVFVGIGCPRQEVWAYEFREAIGVPLLAVGAAFSFHAGQLAQAPSIFQERGLEWLYRLVHEPRRLWKRYLILNPLYLALVFAQWLHLGRFDPQNARRPGREMLYG